jgi:hypothetical protein
MQDCGRAQYLQADWNLGRGLDVRSMLSSAMVYASDGERNVQNKHDLSSVNVVQQFPKIRHVSPKQRPRNRHPIQMLSVCTDGSTSALKQRLSSRPKRACKQPELQARGLQVRWPFCRFCQSQVWRTTTWWFPRARLCSALYFCVDPPRGSWP